MSDISAICVHPHHVDRRLSFITSHGQAHDRLSPVDFFCDTSDRSDFCDISGIC